jgi:hypothetical protein
MNDLNDILQRRLRGMAVRILARIEDIVDANLDNVSDAAKFTIVGSDLKMIRSEVLNAAGDTTRSLGSVFEQPIAGKHSFSREAISCLNGATFEITDFEDESVPVIRLNGDFVMLRQIRDNIKAGVVYNTEYVCAGLEDVVDHIIPYLDLAILAGIKIGNGDYKAWRDKVVKLYMEGLE